MNRHLIWIIGGASALGLGVPALAAARSDGTPDDNGVPGEVRGNCDEAEHAADPDCLAGDGTPLVTVTSTMPARAPITVTVPTTIADDSDDSVDSVGSVGDDNSVDGATIAGGVTTTSMADISGPCDEAEHVNDPRCTGAGGVDSDDVDDDSDHSGSHHGVDDDDDDVDDDSSGRSHDDDSSGDDHSGRGRDGSDDGVDDNSGPGGGGGHSDDDSSGRDGSDDDGGSRSGHDGSDD